MSWLQVSTSRVVRRARLVLWLSLVAHGAIPQAAAAQETRAATIAEAQAAKAKAIQPYVPGKAERIAAAVQRRLFRSPEGLYPWLSSVYSGGGLTLGAGYRTFTGDRTYVDARGLLSAKAYKLVEIATESTGAGSGRVDLRAVGGWRDATQVAFYGIGSDSAVDAKTNFRLQEAYAGGSVTARGPAGLVFDLGLSYEDYVLARGAGESPPTEELHTKETAPGLGDSPAFVHMTWKGGFDWRPARGYARRGGLYAISYDGYFDPDNTYTFDRVQAEVVQHIPILRENWVVSLHGVARTTLDDDHTVPYFLMPSLGSGSTLRAYPSWRFRDRHSLLLSGEWRWIPSRMFFDMALFYDAGKVTSRREDLNFDGLKQDVGVGIRLHGPMTTPLRIEVARGSEGVNIVFSGAAAF
jgi:hypothetical protein